ncbi:MAG TPA: type III pantothenate kinase [Steroidobacteraceae bacterium]|jgi:type III pantothenate kinase|nr:type III pantothenate kinase [Steroidobacteraceae bacterium]
MSLLLLDSGNSRLKWALSREPYRRRQAFAARGAFDLNALRGSRSPLDRLFKALRASGLTPRVQGCNVAGAAVERQLRAATRRAGFGPIRLAESHVAECGVRNGYREVWRLGADRWVALVGARHEHPNMDLCIVGIGTAMTIDLLDSSGRHVGGNIIPGPKLMIESLLTRTAGIRRRAGGSSAMSNIDLASSPDRPLSLFAHDTRSGLRAGARHACAAAIEHARSAAGLELGRRPRLLLAGGAMDVIAPLLDSPYWREDDLILRGLAVIASTAVGA